MKINNIKKYLKQIIALILLFLFISRLLELQIIQIIFLLIFFIMIFLLYMIHIMVINYYNEVNKSEKEVQNNKLFEKKINSNSEKYRKLSKKNKELLLEVMKLDEMFYEIINNYGDILYIMNDKHEYEVVNNKFLNFFDLEKESIIGKTNRVLKRNCYSSEMVKIELKQNEDLINGKIANSNFIKTIVNCFGEKLEIDFTKISFNYNNRKYILGILVDITEQINKENEYNNIIIDLRDKIIKRNDLLSYFEDFSQLLNKILVADKTDFENLIIDAYDFSFKLLEEADSGSVYIFENEKVRYLKTDGYDMDKLNSAEIPKERFLKDIKLDSHIEKNLKASDIFITDEGFESNKISESIRIPLVNKKNVIGSMSFDIMKDSNKNFSENSIVLMNTVTKFIDIIISLTLIEFTEASYERNMIRALLNMLEIHDEYTNNHSDNVAFLARKLGERLDLPKEDIERLYWAGIVHDIGKIEIPSAILNKKERLTNEEFNQIKQHPVTGYEALSSLDSLRDIAKYVRHHHERVDGNGYPDGLKDDEIPFISKILTVVDAWDAMISERVYRKPLSIERAVIQLKNNAGTQFDTLVVNEFIKFLFYEKIIGEEIFNS